MDKSPSLAAEVATVRRDVADRPVTAQDHQETLTIDGRPWSEAAMSRIQALEAELEWALAALERHAPSVHGKSQFGETYRAALRVLAGKPRRKGPEDGS